MKLPLALYPNHYLEIEGWSEHNKVVPQGSEVVILDEFESTYKLSIPSVFLKFEISKSKCKIVENKKHGGL